MSPSRRQPPLFEVLGGEARPGEPARPVVHPPSHTAAAPPRRTPVAIDARPARRLDLRELTQGRLVPIAALAVTVIVLVAIAAWSFGYSRGEDAGKASVLPHTSPEEAAVITGQTPSGTPSVPLAPVVRPPDSGAQKPPAAAARPGMPPITGPDPREPANNYLEIVRLTWRDAEAAVRFLQANNVPATCVPLGGLDPATAQAKNAPHLVFVLDPIPSGQYRANEAKRNELIATVRRLGNRWQREEKGASNFREPLWVLYQGN